MHNVGVSSHTLFICLSLGYAGPTEVTCLVDPQLGSRKTQGITLDTNIFMEITSHLSEEMKWDWHLLSSVVSMTVCWLMIKWWHEKLFKLLLAIICMNVNHLRKILKKDDGKTRFKWVSSELMNDHDWLEVPAEMSESCVPFTRFLLVSFVSSFSRFSFQLARCTPSSLFFKPLVFHPLPDFIY